MSFMELLKIAIQRVNRDLTRSSTTIRSLKRITSRLRRAGGRGVAKREQVLYLAIGKAIDEDERGHSILESLDTFGQILTVVMSND